MPHNDAILEQALAELAELSRRVADLTATVSALTSRPAGDDSAAAQDGLVSVPDVGQPFPTAASQGRLGGWPGWPWWAMPPMPPQAMGHPASFFPQHQAQPWGGWPVPFPQAEPAPQSALQMSPAPSQSQAQAQIQEQGQEQPVPVATEPTAQPSSEPSSIEKRTPSTSKRGRAAKAAKKPNTTKKPESAKPKCSSPAAKPASASATTPHLQQPATSGPRAGRRRRRVGSMVISTSLHGLALALLAMVFVAREAEPEPLMITSSIAAQEPLQSPAEIEIEPMEPLEPVPDEMFEPVVPDLAALEPVGPPIDNLPAAGDLPTVDTVSLLDDGLLTGPTTADLLAPIGEAGTGQGGGGSGGSLAASSTMFFGTPGSGTSICFMCDNSRSYDEGGFEMVVGELMRSVASLKPEQSFFVVFFSDEAYPMFFPDAVNTLLPATDDNKQRLQAWITNVEKRTGGQGLREAVEIVESLHPASICFLSDGDHSQSLVERLVSADLGGAVVNTFGMQNLPASRSRLTPERLQKQQQFNQNMIEIAGAHAGVFTPVMLRPQRLSATTAR